MRLLESWIATPLVQSLGWTLLHSLWEGAIVWAALAAALGAIRSARARYAAACVAMLVMLGGAGATAIHLMPDGRYGASGSLPPALAPWNVRTKLDGAGPLSLGLAAIVPWLVPIWMLGVWVFALGHLAGWISVGRLRRRGVCCAPEVWQKNLVRLSARLGLGRPIQLLESCLAEIPMVIGHIRPAILMPIGLLAGLPSGQVEAILLHELAHIRRCDYLVNVLQRSVECLLFYHPAVWWISRVIRSERENCCDDMAVALNGNPHEYASALAALESYRWPGGTPAMAATGGDVVKRIRRLLYPKAPSAGWTPLLGVFLLIAGGSLMLAGWTHDPNRQPITKMAAQSDNANSSRYSKWLNEDVVYIIDDAERAAFEKLTTDEEREKFIEQFWARRDPTPGTPENEFKDEHYRRIAFANNHFGTASGTPGWKTDRGHIYIVYGPPDEIDAHPSGSGNAAHGYELWTYRHVEGVGDNVSLNFVDESGRGDYRIAPAGAR